MKQNDTKKMAAQVRTPFNSFVKAPFNIIEQTEFFC